MEAKTRPCVFFVVLNWNQGEMTADCLESLVAQDYSNFQVIVVDNGSNDGSPAMLRKEFPWITILEAGENLGYSLGNNLGIEAAVRNGAEYIMLLNNDTEVAPDMLSRLVEEAESDSRIGIVGPTMYYADPPDMLWAGNNWIDWKRAYTVREGMGEHVSQDALDQQEPIEVDNIDTCAALISRQAIEAIGLLDGRYFINFDDLDLNVRARRAGYRVVYVPSARMWHKVSASMGLASPATTYYMTRNSLLFFWTHAPGARKVLAPLQIVLRTARIIGAWTFKPKYKDPIFRRRRDANLFALRDFFLGRFGKMGPEVRRICYGD